MTAGGAGRQLSKAGFKQVYVLNGGMAQWRAENLPVTKKR
jgi:rhodanese-related sulfurtransferase